MLRIKSLLAILLLFASAEVIAQKPKFIPVKQTNKKWDSLLVERRKETSREISAFAKNIQLRNDTGRWKNEMVQPNYYIGNHPVFFAATNEGSANTISTKAVRDAFPGLTGAGLRIVQWDEGKVRDNHELLLGNITNAQSNTASFSDHATHVAGTMVANRMNALITGMAPDAKLTAYSFVQYPNNPYWEELGAVSKSSSAFLISNHSYGAITGWYYNEKMKRYEWWGNRLISDRIDFMFGLYSISSNKLDAISAFYPNHLMVFAAGNDRSDEMQDAFYYRNTLATDFTPNHDFFTLPFRGYGTVTTEASAKNVLTVGAISELPTGFTNASEMRMTNFSNWGPTDDGRIKPDVVAKGENVVSAVAYNFLGFNSTSATESKNGTSMAAPAVSGSALLIGQRFNQVTNEWPSSATLKGLIIHTADSKTGEGRPDYRFGWGVMNTRKAIDVLNGLGTNHWLFDKVLSQAKKDTFSFYCAGGTDIVATLCWTDFPGAPSEALDDPTPRLINDLDISIYREDAQGKRILPGYAPFVLNPKDPNMLAEKGRNSLDNVEKIYIANAPPGFYKLVVSHFEGTSLKDGMQPYALIISNVTGLIQEKPTLLFNNSGLPKIRVSWEPFGTVGTTAYIVQRFTPGESGWREVATVFFGLNEIDDYEIAANVQYKYRIVAILNGQPVATSLDATIMTPDGPSAPSNLTAVAKPAASNSFNVEINWKDESDSETEFILEHSTNGNVYFKLATLPPMAGKGATGFFLHANVPANSINYYRIRAVAKSFSSVYTPVVRVNVSEAVPPPIVYLEYAFDTDPGVGLAQPFPLPQPKSEIDGQFYFPVAGLSDGPHKLFIRFYQSNGYWSNTYSSIFHKTTGSESKGIKEFEYFIDADPGVDNANGVPATNPSQNGFNANVSLQNVSDGFHTLGLRAKDFSGSWSNTTTASFYRIKGTNNPRIENFEYFFDVDPGIGSGTQYVAGTNQANDFSIPIDVSGLQDGLHTLYIRAKDFMGYWSNISSGTFIKLTGNGEPANIRRMEYSIDDLPPVGLATPIGIVPAIKQNRIFNIDFSNVGEGMHTIYVRAMDNTGKWSNIYSSSVLVMPGTGGPNSISKLEYFFDENEDAPVAIANTAGTEQMITDISLPIAGLSDGIHFLRVRAIDKFGKFSNLFSRSFLKLTGPSGERKIVELEYVVDGNLLIGQGKQVVISPSEKLNLLFPIGSLSNGKHYLTVRAKDNLGLYSNIAMDSFSVTSTVYCTQNSIVYYRSAVDNATSYQWQLNTGSGWVNLDESSIYAGVKEQTLKIMHPPTNWYGYQYRCLTEGSSQQLFTLKFNDTWTGAIDDDWHNPANWCCYGVPDEYTDVIIDPSTTRKPKISTSSVCRSLTLKPGALLKIEDGQTLEIKGQ